MTVAVPSAPAHHVVSPGSETVAVAVASEHVQVDVSLPVDVPIAYLLPVLLELIQKHTVRDPDSDSRHDHGAGTVRVLRLDDADSPLGANDTLRSAGVAAGDRIRLDTQHLSRVPLLHDDVVDAAARLNRGGLPGWSGTAARRLALAGVALTSAAWVILLFSEAFSDIRSVAVGLAAVFVVALTGIAAWSGRTAEQYDTATVLGWAAHMVAAAAVWTALSGWGGYALAAGSAALMVTSWVMARLVGAGHGGYLASGLVFGCGAVLLAAHTAGAAAETLGAALAATATLSCLAVPHLWRRSAHRPAQPNTDSPPFEDIWGQARCGAATRTGIYVGLAATTALGVLLILRSPEPVQWHGLLLATLCAGVVGTCAHNVGSDTERTALLTVSAALMVFVCAQAVGAMGLVPVTALGVVLTLTASTAVAGLGADTPMPRVLRHTLEYGSYLLVAGVLPAALWVVFTASGWGVS